jgi:hypothetical protein
MNINVIAVATVVSNVVFATVFIVYVLSAISRLCTKDLFMDLL